MFNHRKVIFSADIFGGITVSIMVSNKSLLQIEWIIYRKVVNLNLSNGIVKGDVIWDKEKIWFLIELNHNLPYTGWVSSLPPQRPSLTL